MLLAAAAAAAAFSFVLILFKNAAKSVMRCWPIVIIEEHEYELEDGQFKNVAGRRLKRALQQQ